MLQYPKAYIGRYLLILRQVQIQRKYYDTRAVLCPNSPSLPSRCCQDKTTLNFSRDMGNE